MPTMLFNPLKESAMEHQVRLEKGRSGWSATTDVKLEGTRVLRIRTSKHEIHGRAAGVSAHASVHKVDGQFISMDLFGDYSKIVARDSIARCTEKSVGLVHAKALAGLEATLAEVAAFYAAKEAKKAAEAQAA